MEYLWTFWILMISLLSSTWKPVYSQAPSAPSVSSQTSSTSIILTWVQDMNNIVESYTISYSFMVIGCEGLTGSIGSNEIIGISGSVRMYTISNLEEYTEFTIAVTAVNGAGSATAFLSTITTNAASPASPSLSIDTISGTFISITWSEIPCLQRNGKIFRYLVSYCDISGSGCSRTFSVGVGTIRMYNLTNLIPRTYYNISIRADSEDTNFLTYIGSFSSPTTVETAMLEGRGFLLRGIIYSRNSAVDLTNIAHDEDALRCLTPLVACCRASDTNGAGSLGNWIFPNGSLVPARTIDTTDISRTRGPSSIILHRTNNAALSPTGVYTCEIPDVNGTTTELDIFLYVGQIPDLTVTLEYTRQSAELTCMIHGGIVLSIVWIKDGTPITTGTTFIQAELIIDRLTVTTRVVLSTNTSNFLGIFECFVTDGNGRYSASGPLQLNGVGVIVSPPVPLIVGQDATLTCVDDVGVANLIEWRTRDGIVLSYNTSVARLDYVLSPVNDSLIVHDNEFICHITRNTGVFNQTIYPTVMVPSPAIGINVSRSGSVIAGSELNLTCVVYKLLSGLTNSPMATWTAISIPGSIGTTTTADTAVAVLNINPLKTSHHIGYNCHGSLLSPAGNRLLMVVETFFIQPQIPAPNVSIVMSPGPQSINGVEDATLTCTASVNREIVDFGALIYSFSWIDRNGSRVINTQRTIVTTSPTSSSSTLTISPLISSDTMFSCSVTISEVRSRLQRSDVGTSSIILSFPNPVVFVSIRSYPINSNYYSGLELNLTCAINIYISVLDDVRHIRVSTQWTRYNTVLTTDNRRTITLPQEVGPMTYNSNVIFNSLDKDRDEGDYSCEVEVNFETDNKTLKIMNSTMKTIAVPSIYFQLLFGGISECSTWRKNEANLKDSDILMAIVNLVSLQCGCDFTSSRLTDRVFLCDPSSPHTVTYQAQLHGTSNANVTQLASIVQSISQQKRSFPVRFSLLTIQNFCVVSSTTLSPCDQRSTTDVLSSNIIIAIVSIIAAVLLILVLIGIILICMMMRKKRNVKIIKKTTTAVPLDNQESDLHEYEEIEKYRSTVQETNIGASPDGVEMTACPAYAPTTLQSDVQKTDVEYEVINN